MEKQTLCMNMLEGLLVCLSNNFSNFHQRQVTIKFDNMSFGFIV